MKMRHRTHLRWLRAAHRVHKTARPVTQAIFASSGGGGEKKDEVDKAVEALVEGARKYRRKFNRPPVLVLDDVDRCAGLWTLAAVRQKVFSY